MQSYRYPWRLLAFDGLRAAFGIAITFGPLLFLAVSRPLAIVLGALGLLFLWFGIRVLAQCVLSIMPSADGFSISGLQRRYFAWKDLKGLRLAYYAPMRRQNNGWYQLTLMGKEGAVRLDSTLDGFDDLLRSASDAATQAKLTLDPPTRENLAALVPLSGGSPAKGSETIVNDGR